MRKKMLILMMSVLSTLTLQAQTNVPKDLKALNYEVRY